MNKKDNIEKKIILYGAGETGKKAFVFLDRLNLGNNVIGFCDQDISKRVNNLPTYTYEECKNIKAEIIITIENKHWVEEVYQKLRKDKLKSYRSLEDYLKKRFGCVPVHNNFYGKMNNHKIHIMGIRNKKLGGNQLKWDIRGHCNLVNIGENVKFSNVVISLLDSYNIINIGDDVELKDTVLRIDGRGGIIDIKKGTIIYGARLNVCEDNKISLGENCLLSTEIEIRSGDGHAIYNSDKKRLNPDKDITIGAHVWIGKRVMILKGVSIAGGCIVGGGSLVNKQFLEKNCIIAGNPAKVIKHEIAWKR